MNFAQKVVMSWFKESFYIRILEFPSSKNKHEVHHVKVSALISSVSNHCL